MTLDYEPMIHAFVEWYFDHHPTKHGRWYGMHDFEVVELAKQEWRELLEKYQKIKAELPPPVDGWIVKTKDGWIKPGHG
jgi:hypothetical protein